MLFGWACYQLCDMMKKYFYEFAVEELYWPALNPDHNPFNTFGMNWSPAVSQNITDALETERE